MSSDPEVRARIKLISERVSPAAEDCDVVFNGITGLLPVPLHVRAGVFDPSRGKSARRMAEAILAHPPPDNARVLEIGTGSGILSIIAFRQAHIALTAVDINPVAVACANDNFTRNNVQAHCAVSDLFSAVQGKFDCIIFNAPTAHSSVKPGAKGETTLWDTTGTLKQRFVDSAIEHLRGPDAQILMMYARYRDYDSTPDLSRFDARKLLVESDAIGESGVLRLTPKAPSSGPA